MTTGHVFISVYWTLVWRINWTFLAIHRPQLNSIAGHTHAPLVCLSVCPVYIGQIIWRIFKIIIYHLLDSLSNDPIIWLFILFYFLNTHTHTQTDRQADGRTDRNQPIFLITSSCLLRSRYCEPKPCNVTSIGSSYFN